MTPQFFRSSAIQTHELRPAQPRGEKGFLRRNFMSLTLAAAVVAFAVDDYKEHTDPFYARDKQMLYYRARFAIGNVLNNLGL